MKNSLEQLKWRCRRGTLELDLLLLHYLDHHYAAADAEEQGRFIELLSWEDGELLDVLLGGKQPTPDDFSRLVDKISGLSLSEWHSGEDN